MRPLGSPQLARGDRARRPGAVGCRNRAPDVAAERAEIEALSQAIAGLPPAQRQAVILRDFYGQSYREVSLALGVSGSAVESPHFKGRKRLQERLRPLRAAAGVAALPATMRDALAQLIPGSPAATFPWPAPVVADVGRSGDPSRRRRSPGR